MTRVDSLLAELAHEARTTRRHLERLPGDRFEWRPHPKSFTAGRLASHLVECIRWVVPVFTADELDMDPSSYVPVSLESGPALLKAFDADVDKARRVMKDTAATRLAQPWRLKLSGKVMFEKTREAAFRDMTLSHLIHHRGQLSVYLRLLEVPVPATYGPSADEGV